MAKRTDFLLRRLYDASGKNPVSVVNHQALSAGGGLYGNIESRAKAVLTVHKDLAGHRSAGGADLGRGVDRRRKVFDGVKPQIRILWVKKSCRE